MKNPFGPDQDSSSYADLKRRMLQRVHSANINDQILEVIKKSLEAEKVVLSLPERQRLFSQVVKQVSEDLTEKLEDGSIPI